MQKRFGDYRMTYRRSKSGMLWGSLAFVGVIIFALILWRGQCLVMTLIVVFGFVALMFIARFGWFGDPVLLTISDDGIAAKDWGRILVRWEDIAEVKTGYWHRLGPCINVILRNENKYLSNLSGEQVAARKISKLFAGASFSFLTTDLDAPTMDVYAEIHRRLAQSRQSDDA